MTFSDSDDEYSARLTGRRVTRILREPLCLPVPCTVGDCSDCENVPLIRLEPGSIDIGDVRELRWALKTAGNTVTIDARECAFLCEEAWGEIIAACRTGRVRLLMSPTGTLAKKAAQYGLKKLGSLTLLEG